MTIKVRNRFNIALFVISVSLLAVNAIHFIIAIKKYPVLPANFFLPDNNFSLRAFITYNPISVYISLFVFNIYVCVASFIMLHRFEKTQCMQISYFYTFLIACLAETVRLYIPLFNLEESFSLGLVILGRSTTFARLLAPLSILFSVIMCEAEQRQTLERDILLIVVVALFFSQIIPMNTAVIDRNFRVHIGYNTIVVSIEVFVDVVSFITLIIKNYINELSQKTAVGMFFIIAGFVLLINSFNFVLLAVATFSIFFGSILYLNTLHQQSQYD